jgi:serine/threonine protein kinase
MASDSPAENTRRYSRIGNYDIVAHIATGGICAVYKAIDVVDSREVALKILPPDLANKPAILERFRREARSAAKLRHENIVTIHEFGESAGTYFLALEFIEGTDLLQYVVEKGRLDPEEALFLLTQATRALDHLHKHRIVHRDIKPSNILLTKKDDQWLAKLTDLGLAREVRQDEFRVTKAGFTVGTIDYMSPEQARDSGLADIRSDIYSLGCTWYHMLAGQPPFAEGGLTERLYKHLAAEIPDIRLFNPKATAEMLVVLRRMMAKKPNDRYQSPAELLNDLRFLGSGRAWGTGVVGTAAAREKLESAAASLVPSKRDLDSSGDVDVSAAQSVFESGRLPQLTPEQRQAAAGQFERANQVIALGNYDYGIHLLVSCCKIDPGNLAYRRTLRRTENAKFKDKRASRLRFFTTSRAKTRLKAAKAAEDHLKVLEAGEEILTRDPFDVPTQIDMAEAAEALGLLDLAIWILRQVWQKESPLLGVTRQLARLHEKREDYAEAIAFWEMVHKADPEDIEASRKSRDLAAAATIARGQYHEIDPRTGTELE